MASTLRGLADTFGAGPLESGPAPRCPKWPNAEPDAYREAYIARLLDNLHPANEATIREYIQAKQAQGLKSASLMNIAVCLARLDSEAVGESILALDPCVLTSVLERYSRRHSPTSVNSWPARVRAFFRHYHDGELPKEIRRALKRVAKNDWRDVHPISEDEFQALLEIAGEGPQRGAAARRQALLWVLWDTGFRISEALSLRVQDFLPDQKGGAILKLPSPKEAVLDLKTGTRSVYVEDCVGPLQLWLQLHPQGTDPNALLFNSKNDPYRAMWPNNACNLLASLCKKAEIRKVSPHLFRHTRATRAARAGWNEPQMRNYFGWAPGSDMPRATSISPSATWRSGYARTPGSTSTASAWWGRSRMRTLAGFFGKG